jgi:hypothetical protein
LIIEFEILMIKSLNESNEKQFDALFERAIASISSESMSNEIKLTFARRLLGRSTKTFGSPEQSSRHKMQSLVQSILKIDPSNAAACHCK